MKIFYYTPAYRQICSIQNRRTAMLDAIWATENKHDLFHYFNDGPSITKNRNRAMRWALSSEFDMIFMIDSDVSVELISPLGALFNIGDCAVAAANYRLRDGIRNSVHPFKRGEVGYECQWAGTGIMLVDLRWIREVGWVDGPWFNRELTPDGQDTKVGEDAWFCREVRGRGGRILANTDLVTSHRHEIEHRYEPRYDPHAAQ